MTPISKTSYTYNENGQIESETLHATQTRPGHRKQFVYNENGQVKEETVRELPVRPPPLTSLETAVQNAVDRALKDEGLSLRMRGA